MPSTFPQKNPPAHVSTTRRKVKCKHNFAASYVRIREEHRDGSVTVTETLTVSKRKTYPQNWPAYNQAQTNEKDKFQSLLSDLCRGIQATEESKPGRPRLPLGDAVFSSTFEVYSTFSGRRFMSDLREAETRGFIAKTPHYNSIRKIRRLRPCSSLSSITQSSRRSNPLKWILRWIPPGSPRPGFTAGLTTSTVRSGKSMSGSSATSCAVLRRM